MKRIDPFATEAQWTVAIDEPKTEMVACVAKECGLNIPKHEGWRVTVEKWEPIAPDSTHTVTLGDTFPWVQTARSWSAAAQAMLTAAAPRVVGPVYTPAATHVIYTYTGYGCCEDHASQGAMELQA